MKKDLDIPYKRAPHPLAEAAYAELLAKVRTYIPEQSLGSLELAYHYAAEKHKSQSRASGEPYILHPIAVATILADLKVDLASLIAAVLHDVVEDTDTTVEDIEDTFGKTMAQLVDGLTKMSKIKFRSSQEKLAENFRKMVLAMASDLRVILVKLADRLHNMRTLGHLALTKRQRIANETLEIYAPLANRLGIYSIKSELEDLCLREAKPEIYQEIKGKVAAKKTQREAYIKDVKSILQAELEKYGFKNSLVYGRPKHFYSIYKKMVGRHVPFEDIHDLFAFRIIVESVKDCYEALGIVHAMWKPMPGRFKDYIAMPKANLYQSLHTTVIRPNGEPAEIQIRTKDMQRICEFGVAAHWAYKEKSNEKMDPTDLKKFSWLRQIMEWQSELKDPNEFLEAVKVDLFEEEIFVFTPKGDVLQLPSGATALDFAFAVHTDVGLTTVGAKINGRMIPIRKDLQSGDIIEILTSSNQKPNKDWLNFVVTSKARNKIRSYLRSAQRDQSRKIGKDLLTHALNKQGKDLERLIKTDEIDHIIKTAKESSLDDVMIAIGYGKLAVEELLTKAYPPPDKGNEELLQNDFDEAIQKAQANAHPPGDSHASAAAKGGVLVSGLDHVLITFARCCSPLPGDRILGFITRGRGVTIHRENCRVAADLDPHRRIAVAWHNDAETQSEQNNHTAFIRVHCTDRQGILGEITTTIAKSGANIHQAHANINANMVGEIEFELKIKNLTQLEQLLNSLEQNPGVVEVHRRDALKHSSAHPAHKPHQPQDAASGSSNPGSKDAQPNQESTRSSDGSRKT